MAPLTITRLTKSYDVPEPIGWIPGDVKDVEGFSNENNSNLDQTPADGVQ